MTISVRLAHADERLVLVGIHLATCGLMADSSAEAEIDAELAWMQRLGDGRHQTHGFVAEDDGVLVGIVAAGPHPYEETTGTVSRLYVDPACVGRGFGTLLHDRAISHLVDHGFTRATLSFYRADAETQDWCQRRGWQACLDSSGHGRDTEWSRILSSQLPGERSDR